MGNLLKYLLPDDLVTINKKKKKCIRFHKEFSNKHIETPYTMYVYFYPLFCGKDLCAKISEELEDYIDNSYCIEIIVSTDR